MRFFITAALCRIKLSLNRYFFAALILFGVFIAIVALAFGEQRGLKMNVGVYSASEWGSALFDKFQRSAGEHIEVVRYDELERLKDDVATRRLECGYAILDQESSPGGKILLYKSSETLGDKASSILLTAVHLEDMAGEFGYKTVKAFVPRELRSEAAEDIALRNAEYLKNATYMAVEYSAVKVSSETSPPNTLANALSGTTAIFSGFLTMLWCSPVISQRGNLFYRRLMLTGIDPRLLFFANLTAVALLNAIFLVVSGVFLGISLEWLITASAYIFCIAAICTLLSVIIKSEALFLGLTMAWFLCSILFSGVFVDLSEINALQRFAGIKLAFPVYYYMRGISGDLTAVCILTAMGFISAIGIAVFGVMAAGIADGKRIGYKNRI